MGSNDMVGGAALVRLHNGLGMTRKVRLARKRQQERAQHVGEMTPEEGEGTADRLKEDKTKQASKRTPLG